MHDQDKSWYRMLRSWRICSQEVGRTKRQMMLIGIHDMMKNQKVRMPRQIPRCSFFSSKAVRKAMAVTMSQVDAKEVIPADQTANGVVWWFSSCRRTSRLLASMETKHMTCMCAVM